MQVDPNPIGRGPVSCQSYRAANVVVTRDATSYHPMILWHPRTVYGKQELFLIVYVRPPAYDRPSASYNRPPAILWHPRTVYGKQELFLI